MPYDDELLERIYYRTNGRCHLCHIKLSFVNYGEFGRRGAWEVDHSRPRARGGTDRLSNLLPACIPCNREKKTRASRTVRSYYGHTRSPLSKEQEKRRETRQAIGWGLALLGVFAVASLWTQPPPPMEETPGW